MTRWLRPVIAVLALSEGGYMALDGIRALIVGDYITPGSGRFQGQVGPWSAIVAAVGIPARSTLMKSIFVAYGVAWLVIILAYSVGARWGWWAMLLLAVASLWYLPLGTFLSLLIIGFLWLQRSRSRPA